MSTLNQRDSTNAIAEFTNLSPFKLDTKSRVSYLPTLSAVQPR